MRAHLLLAPALAATALVVGCEWTSSDGMTWDESYNAVNFSGTYNLSRNVSTTEEGTTASTRTTKEKFGSGDSGSLAVTPVVPGSVQLTISTSGGNVTLKDNADGSLSDSTYGVTGSINYTSGAWSYNKTTVIAKRGTPTSVSAVYSSYASGSSGSSTVVVQYVTVHQTGQNVSLTFDNGYSFSGKISGFSTDADSIQHAQSVIAKFNVSGQHGTITGTLNSLYSSRQIDGVWNDHGSAFAIEGSAIGAGRTISDSTESIED